MRNETLTIGQRYARELTLIAQSTYMGKNWKGDEKLIFRQVFTDGIYKYVYSGKNLRLTLGQKSSIRFTVKRQDTKYNLTRMARLHFIKGNENEKSML